MGCGETLGVTTHGEAVCMSPACPRPTAVHELLDDAETEHVVTLHDEHFTVMHPLRERLDTGLFACQMSPMVGDLGHELTKILDTDKPYRVRVVGDELQWELTAD